MPKKEDSVGNDPGRKKAPAEKLAGDVYHTYLRLSPELRARVDGPHKADEPSVAGLGAGASARHPILQGFEETDILPFGGLLEALHIEPGVEVLLTYIPQFPVYPPEKAWMREPKTDIPGLLLNRRVVFLPADLDRQYGRSNLPDHGNLLKNMIRWAVGEELPITVDGVGLVDCHLYRQPGRLVLHVVNLTSAATWRQPLDEFIGIGPLKIGVKLPEGIAGKYLRRHVSCQTVTGIVSGGWVRFEIDTIKDHEVVVIS
jgi:hypothetical protein